MQRDRRHPDCGNVAQALKPAGPGRPRTYDSGIVRQLFASERLDLCTPLDPDGLRSTECSGYEDRSQPRQATGLRDTAWRVEGEGFEPSRGQ